MNELILAGGLSDTAAYVDFPNGMISPLLTNATFEAWYSINSPQPSRRCRCIFDFGSTDAPMLTNGELTAQAAAAMAQDFLFYAPRRSSISRLSGSASGTKIRSSVVPRRAVLVPGVYFDLRPWSFLTY